MIGFFPPALSSARRIVGATAAAAAAALAAFMNVRREVLPLAISLPDISDLAESESRSQRLYDNRRDGGEGERGGRRQGDKVTRRQGDCSEKPNDPPVKPAGFGSVFNELKSQRL